MNILTNVKNSLNLFKGGVSKDAAKLLLKAQKYGPKIAVYAGAAGSVVAFAWGIKKTLSAEEVIDAINSDIHEAKELNLGAGGIAKAYAKGAWKITKFYAGPVLVEIGSIALILYGVNVIDGRLVAMTATATALEELNNSTKRSWVNYREALKEKYGENFDEDIKWDSDYEISTESPVDKETGEEGAWKLKQCASRPDGISPYAVIFDETSSEWSNDPEYNKMTLLRIQQTCNDMLHSRGYLFLNEVYHELGLPATRIGQMVGWLDDGNGDGFVSFGIFDVEAVNNRSEFINGFEPSILLDFNVDGVIWDKI